MHIGRVGKNGDLRMSGGIKGVAYRFHAPVHHIRRGNDVCTCAGLHDGHVGQQFQGFIVLYASFSHYSVVGRPKNTGPEPHR